MGNCEKLPKITYWELYEKCAELIGNMRKIIEKWDKFPARPYRAAPCSRMHALLAGGGGGGRVRPPSLVGPLPGGFRRLQPLSPVPFGLWHPPSPYPPGVRAHTGVS